MRRRLSPRYAVNYRQKSVSPWTPNRSLGVETVEIRSSRPWLSTSSITGVVQMKRFTVSCCALALLSASGPVLAQHGHGGGGGGGGWHGGGGGGGGWHGGGGGG